MVKQQPSLSRKKTLNLQNQFDLEAQKTVNISLKQQAIRNNDILTQIFTNPIKPKPIKIQPKNTNWKQFLIKNNKNQIHDSSFIALDCQMVLSRNQKNIQQELGRISLVDQSLNVLEDQYVRPYNPVVDYLTRVSGLTKNKLRTAARWHQICPKINRIIKNKTLIGHTIENDFKVLKGIKADKYIDIAEYKWGKGKIGLRSLCQKFLKKSIQIGQHCSVQDAKSTMQLFQKFNQTLQ